MGIFFVFAGLMCIDMFSVGPQFEASLRKPPHVQKFREVSQAFHTRGVDVKNEGIGQGPYPFDVDFLVARCHD